MKVILRHHLFFHFPTRSLVSRLVCDFSSLEGYSICLLIIFHAFHTFLRTRPREEDEEGIGAVDVVKLEVEKLAEGVETKYCCRRKNRASMNWR